MSTARASTKDGQPLLTADVPPAGMRAMGGRIGDALAIGNEGSGTVVAAGDSPEAQALIGKTVALLGGEMYAEYRCLPVRSEEHTSELQSLMRISYAVFCLKKKTKQTTHKKTHIG